MPLYTFECRGCGYREDLARPIALRNEPAVCPKCTVPTFKGHALVYLMRRVPTSASFTIHGFNAKNGYSK